MLSETAKFYGRYDKNILAYFLLDTVYNTATTTARFRNGQKTGQLPAGLHNSRGPHIFYEQIFL